MTTRGAITMKESHANALPYRDLERRTLGDRPDGKDSEAIGDDSAAECRRVDLDGDPLRRGSAGLSFADLRTRSELPPGR